MKRVFPRSAGLVCPLAVTLVVTIAVGRTHAQTPNFAQASCINALNAAGAGVARAAAGQIAECVGSAARGRLEQGQSAQDCLGADTRGKIAQATVAAGEAEQAVCQNPPPFGYSGADATSAAAVAAHVDLAADVFGNPLDDAIGSSPAAALCQRSIVKAYAKVFAAKLRAFQRCKKDRLGDGALSSGEDLEGCIDEVRLDPRGKIGRFAIKLVDKVSACESAGVEMSEAFPGVCGGAADAATCIERQVECRACLLLNAMDAITANCDLFDDGAANATCDTPGGTTTTTGPPPNCGNGTLEAGEACDDGNNSAGDCCAANCTFEAPSSTCTSDGNPCTNDRCDAAGNCTHASTSGSCNDGLFCNGTDTCGGGTCSQHSGNPCAGGPVCANVCNEAADTCNVAAGTTCTSDGNACTDDRCDGAGSCAHPNNSASCNDGLFCNGADTCGGGSCSQHAGDPCSGGGPCAGTCDEGTNECGGEEGTPCADDGNPCTDDTCDGSGDCTHTPNTASCDDGVFCNGADTCSGGTCSQHAGDPCTGGAECADSCNEAGDVCADTAGTACTDDGNGCTDDACDGAGACAHPANAASCDDGLFCNGADACSGGTCSSHVGDPCAGGGDCANSCSEITDSCNVAAGTACSSDSNACTDDRCNGSGTCMHEHNSAPCDDGIFCNGADTCNSGSCSLHPGNPCPGADGDGDCSEVCNETTNDCTANDPNGSGCNDGLYCNGTDSCLAGACSTHANAPCPGVDNDGNCVESCNETTDTCNSNDPNDSPCNDGLFCTLTDRCTNGVCGGSGTPCPGPDDDQFCNESCNETADNCTANDPNGSECDDGLFCTLTDVCTSGSCGASDGPCPVGDGDNDCSEACLESADSCTANDPAGAACTDNNTETGPDTCNGSNVCTGPFIPCQQKGQCRMFVTSSATGGNIGGLAGADAVCNQLAGAAGLFGTFQAWLCDGINSPATRSTKNSVPYVRTDGARIADNWGDLTDGGIQNAINRNESGTGVGSPYLPWTLVKTDGSCDDESYLSPGSGPCGAFSYCPNNCAANGNVPGWNTDSGWVQGSKGDVNATGSNWTDGATGLCSTPAERIYCIEQ